MTTNKFIKVLHAGDGDAMFQAIRDDFSDSAAVSVDDDPDDLPPAHSSAVLVFLVTTGTYTDNSLAESLTRGAQSGLPVLPVMPSIADYGFAELPDALAVLQEYNVIGWDQGREPGQMVFDAIRRYLGLMPFKRHCKVFISYRRSDAAAVAQQVHAFLHRHGYRVFLDTEDMQPGEQIQDRIDEEISERDFLLLLDSPDAAGSEWVRREITLALTKRVTVYALRLPGSEGFPLLRDTPALIWEPADPERLVRLERHIARAIAARTDFDQRVDRTLREFARLNNCRLQARNSRQMLLFYQQKSILLDFEDAPLTLDRLYRLYESFIHHPLEIRLSGACFIHGGLPLSEYERRAFEWARQSEPLQATALSDLFTTLKLSLG